MSSARSDLFIYIGVALATTIGLFVLHQWYASFVDIRYHQQLEEGGASEALLAAREEEQRALQAGKMPLAQAMDSVARKGRPASITPAPSEDLSAVSGWIHARDFKPATAFPVRTAKPPQPAAAPAAAPETSEPEAAPAAPTGPTTGSAPQLRLKTEVLKQEVAR